MRELGIEIPDERSVRHLRLAAPAGARRARRSAARPPGGDGAGDRDGDRRASDRRRRHRPPARGDPRRGAQHTTALASLRAGAVPRLASTASAEDGPQVRLARILGRERWHRASGGWISGAIYGANDGLAAVFGLVAGFSGRDRRLASRADRRASSARSARRSRWRPAPISPSARRPRSPPRTSRASARRCSTHPEEEKEELSLFYQLKGLTAEEADMLVERIAQDPEKLLRGDRDRGARQRGRGPRRPGPGGARRRHLDGASARSSPCSRSSGSPATAGRDRRRVGVARRALRGRRREVAVHAAQRVVRRARDDARRRRRRRRDLPARASASAPELAAAPHALATAGHKRAPPRDVTGDGP